MIRAPVALLMALSLSPRPSAAQRCGTAEVDAEEREAQALNLSSRHEEALTRYAAIAQRCQLPRTLARLAITEAALGRWLDADAHLRAALDARDPWVEEHRAALEVEAARVGSRLGTLLVVGHGPPGEVFVNGARAASWPMREPVRVPAGTVSVRVVAEGCDAVERTIRVEPRVLMREEVTLAPRSVTVEPAPPSQSPTPPSSAAPLRNVARSRGPWTAIGVTGLTVGVGLLAAGMITAVLRGDALDDLSRGGCYGAAPDTARCDAIADSAERNGAWSVGGLVAGGTLVALSAGALITGAVLGSRADRAFRCAPTLALAGARCELRF